MITNKFESDLAEIICTLERTHRKFEGQLELCFDAKGNTEIATRSKIILNWTVSGYKLKYALY